MRTGVPLDDSGILEVDHPGDERVMGRQKGSRFQVGVAALGRAQHDTTQV